MLTAPSLGALARVRHGFFTRTGGVSEGAFASLNCGYSSGDDVRRVEANRARALERLGMAPESLCTVRQVHGTKVVVAHEPQPRRPTLEADALVADRPGITLGVLSADCAPVLLADVDAGVIGAAHAGWRGALAGVIEATVEAMAERGAVRERTVAVVGPCIAQASYEVGPELLTRFTEEDPGSAALFRPVPEFRPAAVRPEGLCPAAPRRRRRRAAHGVAARYPCRRSTVLQRAPEPPRRRGPLRSAALGDRADRVSGPLGLRSRPNRPNLMPSVKGGTP